MLSKILAAVDGSENGWSALDFACCICAGPESQLIVLHVVVRTPIPEQVRRFGSQEHLPEPYDHLYYEPIIEGLHEAARKRAFKLGVKRITWIAEFGDPAEVILAEAASHEVEVIVMGRRGFGTAKRLLMGSVSHKVSNLAHCTCVTVR